MEQRGISGSTLKMIAVITMLIDHIGAGILGRVLSAGGVAGITGTMAATLFAGLSYQELYQVYHVMRQIGRIAFPIYCFLLVEGFDHTRNRKKYAIRLGIFALISEIPFDLAFRSRMLETGYQNVFFTLFIGLCTMIGVQYVLEHVRKPVLSLVAELAIMFAGMIMAEVLSTDYGALGVFCIMVFYLCRHNRLMQIVAGCLAFCWWELPALLAFIPIFFYNGKRGWNIKYFFYAFYPVHLLLIYLVCLGLGIATLQAF
jgi:hypothetical protein